VKRDYTIENLEQYPPLDVCIGEIYFNKDDDKMYMWMDKWEEFEFDNDPKYDNIEEIIFAYNMFSCRKHTIEDKFTNVDDIISTQWSLIRLTEIMDFLKHIGTSFDEHSGVNIQLADIVWKGKSDNTIVNIEVEYSFFDMTDRVTGIFNFQLNSKGYMFIHCDDIFKLDIDPMFGIVKPVKNVIDELYPVHTVQNWFYRKLFKLLIDWF
jgi:hypothetical protein